MPSFDVVSELDRHELSNAVAQANKEVCSRFDFKGTDSKFDLDENTLTMNTESEFQIEQMYNILTSKLARRGIDILCLKRGDISVQMKTAKQLITLREGLDAVEAKKIVKLIKDKKMKVQASIQGDTVRVSAKKRDALQEVIALLKADDTLTLPLQYKNFRD